jgi:uncharacterized protein involved in outer membrane biogenesis
VKKLLIGLIAAGVLLVAAVLIAPSFIDWNAHKKQISSLVREATGRELTIRGDIDVTLLPSPALRVEDVRLSSVDGAVSPEMVRLPEARISVAFGSLLEGRLAAVVTLIRPTVNLEKLADGRVNWDFAPGGQAAVGAPAAVGSSSGAPVDVRLDSFRIVNGSIGYLDAATGTIERIEKLNSEISFDSLKGPFKIDGTATVRGIPVALKASTGAVRPDGPLSAVVELSVPGGDSTLRLNGTIAGFGAEPKVNGEFELKSDSAAALIASTFGNIAPAVLAQPLSVQGSLSGSKEAVELGAIEIELGGARASGDVKAELADTPRITAALHSGNLNLDALLDGGKDSETPARAAAARDGGSASASAPVPSTPQMKTPETEGVAFPNAEVSLTLGAEIIQFNGALVRDLSVKAALKDGRAVIEDVSVVLPGNTSFGIKGTVAAVDGKADMKLDLSGRSDNLREMLEWVGIDTASIPADRLRRFSLSAAIAGSPRNFTARDISMQLDASKLSGGLAMVLRDRPAFGLRLVVDRVNVDGYLGSRDAPIAAAPAAATAGGANGGGAAKPSGIPALADALRLFEKFDANIDATVKSFIIARTPASDLHLDFTVLNGGLQVRQAGIGDLGGLKANLKGTLDRSKEQPTVAMDYALEIVDAARFARFIDKPALLERAGSGRLVSTGKLDGNLEQLALNSRIEALGMTIDINGVLTSLLQEPAFKLATSVRAPELVQVVRLAVDDYAPAAGKLGPVDLAFQFEGTRHQVKADSITGHAGPVALHGSADITFGEVRPRLKAALSTSEVSLDLFLPPERRKASRASTEYRVIPAAASAAGTLPASASSRWSAEPIDVAMLGALDAEVSLDMAVLAKDPYRFKDSKLRLRLEQGKLSLEQMEAAFSTGTVTAIGAIAPDEGKLSGSLKFAMNDVDVADLVEALRNYQVRLGPVRFGAKMSGPVNLTGDFSTRGASERELVTGLTGSARLSGQLRTDISSDTRQTSAMAGLAGALLGSRVKEVRGITDAVQGTDLLVSAFEGSSTLNGDITADGGVLTTRNLVLVGRGGRALTTGTASLPAWTLDSATDVTLGQDTDPYLTAQAAGALDDPYIRKVSGTLLRGRPVSTTPSTGQTGQGATPRIVSPQEAEQPSATGSKKIKPEDVLKGLLQGLSR